jgi:hypothetical protein
MIKDKITMPDHLADYWASIGGDPAPGQVSPAVIGAFYAGAAAMAQQFASNGILYLPGAGDSHAVGGPARDTPWSDEALKTVGGEVQGEVQL